MLCLCEISNPEASLCNHQCVVPMIQKMLPVRCNRNSSIKHLLRYQEKNWRSEIVFLECLFIGMTIQQKICPNMHFPLNFGTKTHAIGHAGRTVTDLASNL